MSSPCRGAHGPGTKYTYAELEGLWINAGGSSKLAPIMAAIALAESDGCSAAENPSGASGLWQILGQPFPGNVFDPATNAKMAVSKQKSQGLGAWETYTNGAYKAHMSGRTTPNLAVPSPAGGTGGQADIQPYSPDTCLVSFPGISMPVIGNVGQFCIFSKSEARALIGATIMLGGFVMILPGVAFLAAAAGMKALGAAGPMLQKTGAAVALIPGAEPAGAAIAGAGAAGKASASKTQSRRQAGAREDAALERKVGEPRENPELRTGRGAVRETPAGTRSRQRETEARARRAASAERSRARGRAAARRAARPAGGDAASVSEAGF